MSTQTTQDDSLIILSDDTSINFSPSIAPVKPDTTNMIHLDLPVLTPSPVSITQKEVSETPSTDFSFDFNLDATPIVEANQELTPSSPTELSLAPATTSEALVSSPVSLVSSVSLDDDMDSILDGTIAKLRSRQEIINGTKGKKTSRIDELLKQIEELQQQVSDLKDDVSELTDEHAKIEANVKALENMKMFEVPQADEKSREHNLAKVSKK